MHSPDYFNKYGSEYLPGHLGIVVTHASGSEIRSELPVRKPLIAPNGYLHAGTVVTLADTCAGYGCINNLPEDATGFTTIELKSNHLQHGPRRHHRMRRQSGPSWKNNPGLGFSGHPQRVRKNHRALPLHSNDSICKPRVPIVLKF